MNYDRFSNTFATNVAVFYRMTETNVVLAMVLVVIFQLYGTVHPN